MARDRRVLGCYRVPSIDETRRRETDVCLAATACRALTRRVVVRHNMGLVASEWRAEH